MTEPLLENDQAPPAAEPIGESAGGQPPPEAIQALNEATAALAEADEYEFASDEYTAAVERAMPLLQEGQVILQEAGGDELWPDLMAQVEKTITGCQLYLDVSWGDPEDVVTDVNQTGPETIAPSTPELPEDLMAAVTAGSFPVEPPGVWFNDPKLDEPTPVQVTAEGRVYGHMAAWDTCHTAFAGQCISPPVSPSGYRYFRTGSVITAEGAEIPVGHLTLDTLHARKNASASDAAAHYEHTGRAVADVAAGEDSHGIWVAGALRPDVSEDQVRALRASPLSGDWRRIGGSLELVAVLAVNVPGFPIPRPAGLVAGGTLQSLVASGMLKPTAPVRRGELSVDDLHYLKRLADRERREHQVDQVSVDKAAGLARRVRAMRLHDRIRATKVK